MANQDRPLTTADLVGTSNQTDGDTNSVRNLQEDAAPMERDRANTEHMPRAETTRGNGDTVRQEEEHPAPLLAQNDAQSFKSRWDNIQIGFVDDPRHAVEQADTLVAEVMKKLAEGFATERSNLEQQWSRGGDVSTEDMRVALRRYRSFFQRLLSL